MYIVKIYPIATDTVITIGGFETEEDAWKWIEEHNNPLVDYEVIEEGR